MSLMLLSVLAISVSVSANPFGKYNILCRNALKSASPTSCRRSTARLTPDQEILGITHINHPSGHQLRAPSSLMNVSPITGHVVQVKFSQRHAPIPKVGDELVDNFLLVQDDDPMP
eukprot:CAMPEP_0183337646 /NCGR_PEP_ID=MMETSP0164_2-20130417/5210_1 /TAXON_ID=221442 /ORGANISM="Coccolithus pelagicus ssp braarudi, Strain PLY182g" /LENGTH=115 /DNA_ID=CAMNT_0025507367 /DNA_START=74 /DNA_END=421 /DNA_ORIENTATION=+